MRTFIVLLLMTGPALAQTETVTASITTRSSVTVTLEGGCVVYEDGREIPCNDRMLVIVNGEEMRYSEYLELKENSDGNIHEAR